MIQSRKAAYVILMIALTCCLGTSVARYFSQILPPCKLCVMQQQILVGILVASVIWHRLEKHRKLSLMAAMVVLLLTLSNGTISMYQSLVELNLINPRSCKKIVRTKDLVEFKAAMQKRQIDCFISKKKFFGLSLANYNVLFNVWLLFLIGYYLLLWRNRHIPLGTERRHKGNDRRKGNDK